MTTLAEFMSDEHIKIANNLVNDHLHGLSYEEAHQILLLSEEIIRQISIVDKTKF